MRKRKKVFLRIFLWASLCVLTLPVYGKCGIILKKQSSRLIPGRGKTQVLQTWLEYYQDNKVAVYQRNAIFITDIGSNTLINILPTRRIYAVNSVDDFVQRIEKIVQQIKAQKLFGEKKAPQAPLKVQIKETGKSKKILGYPSQEAEIYVNGKKVEVMWYTERLPLKDEIDVEKAREKKTKIESIFEELSGEKDFEQSKEYQNFMKGQKVPLLTITYNMGTEEIERVVDIKITSIPQRIFQVPEGYKKVPIEQFMRH